MRTILILALMAGCKSGADIDPEGTDAVDIENGGGDTVLDEDPGSGDAAGAYQVVAEAHGEDSYIGTERMFETDLSVRLADAAGTPISGATVHMETVNFGEVTLAEDPGTIGTYEATAFGYDRSYILTIDGPEGEFQAIAVGPAIHSIDAGATPIDAATDWTIEWSPSGASVCELGTTNYFASIEDTGSHTVPAGEIEFELGELGAEEVEIQRGETLILSGAAQPSSFEVTFTAALPDLDTTDTRTGTGTGVVTTEGVSASGTVYVLAWPDETDGEGPAWAWTRIDDFPTTTTYTLTDLAPGDWLLLAYHDADGSDAGGDPAGPTDGDPFGESDVAIDINQTAQGDIVLDQIF